MADAAVAERVSGAPGGGPMLKGDSLKEFASAIAGQPTESPDPAPEPAAPPSEPPAPEPAPQPEVTPDPAAPPADPAPKPSAELPKGPIPYDRFKEVNDQLNAERARIAEYEKRRDAEVKERTTAEVATAMFKIAEQNPELAPLIFRGERPQPKAPPVDPNAPPLTPEQKAIQEIKTQNQTLMAWKQKTEQAAILQNIQDRAEGRMETHPVFKNQAIRDRSEEIIVKRILTEPHIPPETIVDQVAQQFKAIEQSIKDQYVVKKKEIARTVAPGVGPGGPPAPPSHTPQKLKLQDGSALRALANAMKGMQGQPQE